MKSQANILKPRKIKGEVFRMILDDYTLLKKIAEETGNRESTVTTWAYRESDKVSNYFAVNVIKKHTGLKDNQIFQS
ncbi:hypothetical protein [Chryseobacterium sp. 2VB]|uniref:hypothetical protein n=1 Tax=Chryseobacterium sp. 2VB TaxID=2502204 RepID=UPI0010F9A762|nr:hypothetical protein [Chryseobacterium sp. 2VB]